MTTSRISAHQRILETADELFYQVGIRAISMDTIVERSSVGKATLYRHFPTKDDLILAYLEEKNRLYWQRFDDAIATYEGAPKAQLFATLDAMLDRWTAPTYYGCAFLNALAEYSKPDHPVHIRANQHKHILWSRLYEMGQQAGARDPKILADQLLLLINGSLASKPTFGTTGPLEQFIPIARLLIEAQLQSE